MKWIPCVIVAAVVGLGLVARPGAAPAQVSTVPCECAGSFVASTYAHPCIRVASYTGSVKDGRCHRPPPSRCTLPAKPCEAAISLSAIAKDGCFPFFEWTVDGVVQPGSEVTDWFSALYEDELPCASSKLVVLWANGSRVLELVVVCEDC